MPEIGQKATLNSAKRTWRIAGLCAGRQKAQKLVGHGAIGVTGRRLRGVPGLRWRAMAPRGVQVNGLAAGGARRGTGARGYGSRGLRCALRRDLHQVALLP